MRGRAGWRSAGGRRGARIAIALALAGVSGAGACTGTLTRTLPPTPSPGVEVPPVPSISPPGGGARSTSGRQPPLIWVGGTLLEVRPDRLEIRDESGTTVVLLRLGEGATSFYRVSRGTWAEVPGSAQILPGGDACAQTLMDGTLLLAVRVFLGATCGPA